MSYRIWQCFVCNCDLDQTMVYLSLLINFLQWVFVIQIKIMQIYHLRLLSFLNYIFWRDRKKALKSWPRRLLRPRSRRAAVENSTQLCLSTAAHCKTCKCRVVYCFLLQLVYCDVAVEELLWRPQDAAPVAAPVRILPQ